MRIRTRSIWFILFFYIPIANKCTGIIHVPGEEDSDIFIRTVDSGQYVDKSLFISRVIAKSYTLLIEGQHGSGKSTLLDMLYRFLNIEVDKNGNPLPIEKRRYRKYFFGDGIRYSPLKIANQSCTIFIHGKGPENVSASDLQGSFPVIRMSLRGINGTSFKDILSRIRVLFRRVLSDFKYMLGVMERKLEKAKKENNNTFANSMKKDIREFKKYYQGKGIVSHYNFTLGLVFLCKKLREHFGRPVVMLVDDFDSVLNTACEKLTIQAAGFFCNFYVPDEFMYTRILIGIILPPETVYFLEGFTGCRYICSGSLGFSQQEVDVLLKTNNATQQTKDDVKSFYLGYSGRNSALYNPKSVTSCMRSDPKFQLKPYWGPPPEIFRLGNNLLRDKPIRENIMELLQGNQVEIELPYSKFFGYTISKSIEVMHTGELAFRYRGSLLGSHDDNILYILHKAGYFTNKTFTQINERAAAMEIIIPNKELWIIINESYQQYCAETYNLTRETVTDCRKHVKQMITQNKEECEVAQQRFRERYLLYLKKLDFYVVTEDTVECTLFAIINPLRHPFEARRRKKRRANDITFKYGNYGVIFELRTNSSPSAAISHCRMEKSANVFINHSSILNILIFGVNVKMEAHKYRVEIESEQFENTKYNVDLFHSG